MGQLCEKWGWSLDYLLWQVDWRVIQRMLIDAPKYDYDNKENTKQSKAKKGSFDLKEMSGDDFINLMKKGM